MNPESKKFETKILETKNPLELAKEWLAEAQNHAEMTYANAFSLVTVDTQGRPSVRIVLLKEINPYGLVFFTNYNSRKGLEIEQNPWVSVNFYWDKFFRQLKVLGLVQKVSREESVRYWQTRPRESQISQVVSQQSQAVESREKMNQLYIEAEEKFQGQDIPCPEHWGGYMIQPQEMEFWIGREHRFHDRFQFKKHTDHWQIQRLFP